MALLEFLFEGGYAGHELPFLVRDDLESEKELLHKNYQKLFQTLSPEQQNALEAIKNDYISVTKREKYYIYRNGLRLGYNILKVTITED